MVYVIRTHCSAEELLEQIVILIDGSCGGEAGDGVGAELSFHLIDLFGDGVQCLIPGSTDQLAVFADHGILQAVLVVDEIKGELTLDITTLTILEDYMDRYEGIVVTVSHDRYFLDRTMKRIFAFEEDGKLKQYEGGYTDYSLKKLAEKEEQEAEQEKKAGNASKTNTQQVQKGQRTRGPQKLKFTYQEQKDYETIESDIAALEEKIEKLEGEMAAVSTDFVKLNQIMADSLRPHGP